jgi:hypothetical protein
MAVKQIKSRRMRWTGHVTRMGEERKLDKVLWECQKEHYHSEDRGVGRRMESEWMGDVDWIRLAQDRDRWRAVVNLPSGCSATEVVSSIFYFSLLVVGKHSNKGTELKSIIPSIRLFHFQKY